MTLSERFAAIRRQTQLLAEPLSAEDQVLQSMPDASPTKWHLAHTTWFFETFVLPSPTAHRRRRPEYGYLFNSYYEAIGPRVARDQRGLLSRPSLDEVQGYRRAVDEAVLQALADGRLSIEQQRLLELGLNHEQQHQELILTDIKHALGTSPLLPPYRERAGTQTSAAAPKLAFTHASEGLTEIGHAGNGFSFDNERPRHRVFLEGFALANRLTTCGEYRAFIEDGGYARPELWLSDGWAAVRAQGWQAPLYWEKREGHWWHFTLFGLAPIDEAAPVCHVSYYEADAFARWAGARLPTESEWEHVAASAPIAEANLLESGQLVPRPARTPALEQLHGDCWEWTASAYLPYPGFRTEPGAVGEYNGKFMSGQMVLRGGSCFTPRSHLRATYRNFFPPSARWQMSGIRLARDP